MNEANARPGSSSLEPLGPQQNLYLAVFGFLAWFYVPVLMANNIHWYREYYQHSIAGKEEGFAMIYALFWPPLCFVAALAAWRAGRWVTRAGDPQRRWLRLVALLAGVHLLPALGILCFLWFFAPRIAY